MTTKILFWLDVGMFEFGIAKYLQQKMDCETYAIYDLNHHLKKSFKNQKLVNFSKEWFFWDHVSNDNNIKFDLDYLVNFEKKYGINLWTLAYTDRNLFNYNPYHTFEENEILTIFEQEIRFFEKILTETKPDMLIIKTTDFHRNHLLSEMCKALGIEVLMLIPTRLGYRSTIGEDISKFDKFTDNAIEKNMAESFDLQKYLKKFDRLKQTKDEVSGTSPSTFETMKIVMKWLLKTFDSEYRKSYDHFGMTRLNVIKEEIYSRIKASQRKKFIDKSFEKKLSSNEKYVFFPLQVEPERNVSLDAPFFSNQLELIKNIAKSIPVGYWLYVKEHYNMKFRNWRENEYYKAIMSLPNVKLIHPTIKPEEILKNCSLVLTITSTVGLEAAFYKKPTIVFADVIYSELSSVHKLNNIEELPQQIINSLHTKVNPQEVINFVKKMDKNSFEFDAFGFHRDILNRFHNGGLVIGDHISEKELGKFLDENDKLFDFLSDEYLKRILQIEHQKK